MALSAATVFEVRLTGDDTNGGGFVTGASGTDRSQQDAAFATLTTASVIHTNTTQLNVNASDYTVTAADVGNLFQLTGGTATAGVYQITAADTVNNRWSLDRAIGTTGQTCPGKMGGGLGTPGRAGALATTAGMTVYVKYNASPYVITSATTNIAAGCVLGSSNTYWIGYDTVRSPYQIPANRPTFQLGSGVSTAVLFTGTNNTYFLQSVILDCNNQTASRAGFMSGEYFYVKAINGTWNTTGGVLQDNSVGVAILCEVAYCTLTSNANALRMSGAAYSCWAHDNTVASGQHAISLSYAYGCMAWSTAGGGGFSSSRIAANCVSYGNAQHGFAPFNSSGTYINLIAEGNGTYGFLANASRFVLINCASYNNTSGRNNAPGIPAVDIGAITGSASFFTNAAAGDFSLNNTAGAGALCHETGFPTTFPV